MQFCKVFGVKRLWDGPQRRQLYKHADGLRGIGGNSTWLDSTAMSQVWTSGLLMLGGVHSALQHTVNSSPESTSGSPFLPVVLWTPSCTSPAPVDIYCSVGVPTSPPLFLKCNTVVRLVLPNPPWPFSVNSADNGALRTASHQTRAQRSF